MECLNIFSLLNLLYRRINLDTLVKVACVVDIKLFFYGMILLYFHNTNLVMQNPIYKFRQRSIVFEKPGILSDSLKTWTSSNYPTVQYFAETSHTFPT